MEKVVVIKVGSGVLVRSNGYLDFTRISTIVNDVSGLMDSGYKIAIVSSGAVAAGKVHQKLLKGVPRNQRKKLQFSIGQPKLLNFYYDTFSQHNITSGQVLITRESFANRQQYFSIRDTINNLLFNGIIPIINDNDLLHNSNYDFSDNDHLAAYVGGMLNADMVLFLTSVDGLYKVFNENQKSGLIKKIESDFEPAFAAVKGTHGGSGGMGSKIAAAKLLFDIGINSTITNGLNDVPLIDHIEGRSKATRIFSRRSANLSGVRKWLSTGAVPAGSIVVSRQGAEGMKGNKKRTSLLGRGVVEVNGEFRKGDVVSVCNEDRELIGYGITRVASNEIPMIRSEESIVVIHADYFYGTDFSYFND